jgi:hypothetical protein
MQILASITFPDFDTKDSLEALKSEILVFGERPTVANFRDVLTAMHGSFVDIPFNDHITMRVSMNEQIDVRGSVKFETGGDDEVTEICVHCDSETGSDEYNRLHN